MDAGLPEVVHRPSRLRALAALEANAQSSALALDRIAGIACRVLKTPIVLVNLVGSDRQTFVGCVAPDPEWTSVKEMPLTHGFCPFALGSEDAFAFADARENPTLAANPVVEQLGVVAYAGVPLRVANGEPVGTLCAIDREPHEWSEDDLATLSDLGASAVAELQLLAATRQAVRQQSRVRTLAELSRALAPAVTARAVFDRLLPVLDGMDATAVWLLVPGGAAAAGVDPGAIAGLTPLAPGESEFLVTPAGVRERFGARLDAGTVALLPVGAGVLGAGFAREDALTADDRGYLAALAGIASLALNQVGA